MRCSNAVVARSIVSIISQWSGERGALSTFVVVVYPASQPASLALRCPRTDDVFLIWKRKTIYTCRRINLCTCTLQSRLAFGAPGETGSDRRAGGQAGRKGLQWNTEGALKYLTPSAGMTWLGEFRHHEGSLYPNGINDFLLFFSARRLEKDTNTFIYILMDVLGWFIPFS